MTTATNWEELATTSHLDTVTKIKWLLDEQEYDEAREGLETLEESMSVAQKRSIESQLIRLMLHVLKWKYQSERASTSWVRTIANARLEIERWQDEKPSFNQEFINKSWEKCFRYALREAKAEMNLSRKDPFEPAPLTWQEVFEDEYLLQK